MQSAPISAKNIVQYGPLKIRVKSKILIPSKAFNLTPPKDSYSAKIFCTE